MKIVVAIVALLILAMVVLGVVMLFDTTTGGFTLPDSYKWAVGIVIVGAGIAALIMTLYIWWKQSKRPSSRYN